MEKFAEQVTQQLAEDIEKAANYKLAALTVDKVSPAFTAFTRGVGGLVGGGIQGGIRGGVLGAGIGALRNLGNKQQTWDTYRQAILKGAKTGAGIGAGLGGITGGILEGTNGYNYANIQNAIADNINNG